MEEARYWMWPKRKNTLSSHLQPSTNPNLFGDSWEEQAFAEDAAGGALGGYVWPPRSYSCSFCRREFRSAQALGGHMNVHRRDRARLKQSPNSPHHEDLHHHPQQNILYPSRVCTMVSNNPNPDYDHVVLAPPSSSISRVSPPPSQENSNEKTFVPLFSYPILKDYHHKNSSSLYASPSWSTLVADKYHHASDLNSGVKASNFLGSKEDYVKADLSVSLNLVIHQTRPTSPKSCKRRRTDSTTFQFFANSDTADSKHLQSSSSSVEELDLELRLGNRPKVK